MYHDVFKYRMRTEATTDRKLDKLPVSPSRGESSEACESCLDPRTRQINTRDRLTEKGSLPAPEDKRSLI